MTSVGAEHGTADRTSAGARPLDSLFDPRSIAVVGASPTLDRAPMRILDNMRRFGYTGRVYGVHPRHSEVFGYPCFPSLADLPEVPDVVALAVSGDRIVATLEDAAGLGVSGAIVYASALNEAGVDPEVRATEIRDALRPSGMRLLGPNSQGAFMIRSRACLSWSAEFSGEAPLDDGAIAWVSQSGAVGTAVASMLRAAGLGLTHWVSLGNELDIEFSEVVRHVLADPATRVVCGYVESIRDVVGFRAAAAEARRLGKQIILVKGGTSPVGSAAAATHTGALATGGAIYEGLFRQTGVTQVRDLDELVAAAWLAVRRRATGGGRRVAILSNSGGLGIMLADRCHDVGLTVPPLGPETAEALRELLPDFVEAANPLDMPVVSMRYPDDVPRILERLHKLEPFDAYLLVLLGVRETAGYDVDRLLEAIRRADALTGGRLIPVFLSGEEGLADRARRCGVEPAADLGRIVDGLGRQLGPVPWSPAPAVLVAPSGAWAADGHASTLVATEAEAKDVLRSAGITVPDGSVVSSADEAVAAAERLGRPVVLKVVSRDILHKSDIGGVALGLTDAAEVQRAFEDVTAAVRAAHPEAAVEGLLVEAMAPRGVEVVLGVLEDPALGPVIMFGSGGTLVELLQDVAFRCLPISEADAEEMIDETLAARLIGGVRGSGPLDRRALVDLIMATARLAEDPSIGVRDLELNPVLVHGAGRGVTVVDAVLTRRRHL